MADTGRTAFDLNLQNVGKTRGFVYWIRRLSELALLGWLGLLLLVDLAVAISAGGPQLLVPLCGAIGLVVVAVRRRHRVEGLLVLLVFSLGSSVLLSGTGADGVPGLTESGALLVLTVGVLRHVGPIRRAALLALAAMVVLLAEGVVRARSEEHTSELQSRFDLVCRLL